MSVLLAAVATIAFYVFFDRGECGACALVGDQVVSDIHVTLLLRQEKRIKGLNVGYNNVRQIASHEAHRIVALL